MKIKWNGHFQENVFENLVIPQEFVLFFRKLCKIRNFLFRAISFGRGHSELDIPGKHDGDVKMAVCR